jgi:hypothetical protein
MTATIENIARNTATTSPIRRPRTLDELFDQEEALATRGIVQQAERLGGDALDALNIPLHWRRKPLGTGAVVGALGLLFAAKLRRPRSGRRSQGMFSIVRSFLNTSLAGAVVGQITKAVGLSRE